MNDNRTGETSPPLLVVLGTAQDGGYPHAGCGRSCCKPLWEDRTKGRRIACIALIEPGTGETWLIDATPDFREQLQALLDRAPNPTGPPLAGILLTHAHIGHYTGLMYLGREAMDTRDLPVFCMPRMAEFLTRNGPWDQLVRLGNISLRSLNADTAVPLSPRLAVTPFLVPHRDEYSETVGFRIQGPNRSAVFIPDINDWEDWESSIESVLADVDVAYLDGTFFDENEVPGRAAREIPHPLVVDSLGRFASLPPVTKKKVRFIHLNHTNPLLDPSSCARRAVEDAGFGVAEEKESFPL
ncbi:MAG: MBL fold metallo-hydrolase [Planctomycetota bacterium]|jgi:pyrroloquinoline quinone biosynthesis protein B